MHTHTRTIYILWLYFIAGEKRERKLFGVCVCVCVFLHNPPSHSLFLQLSLFPSFFFSRETLLEYFSQRIFSPFLFPPFLLPFLYPQEKEVFRVFIRLSCSVSRVKLWPDTVLALSTVSASIENIFHQ